MTARRRTRITPAIDAALSELQERIAEGFPRATFVVEEGFDPPGVYLVATVDVADTDEVVDLVGDRLVELQVEDGLPVFLVPLRPVERVVAELRGREAERPSARMSMSA